MADDDDALPDLDPELGALISAYEGATARDAAQVDAALARVTARVGAAGGGGAAAASTTKLAIVSGIVGIVGVIGIVALGPSTEPSPPPVTAPTATPQATAMPVLAPPPRERAAAVPPVVATSGDADPVVADEIVQQAQQVRPERGERRTKSSRSSRSSASTGAPDADAAPVESSLEAELELLKQARGALRRGRAEEALEIVRKHRRDYPSSAIAKERDATEVSALCALGRLDAGECR